MKRLALAALALLAGAAPQDDPWEARVYNVEALTWRAPDQPGSAIGILRHYDVGTLITAGDGFAPVLLGGDDLIDLIKTNVDEDSWAHASAKISLSVDGLAVTNRRSVHAKVQQYIAHWRSLAGRLIVVDAAIVSVDPALLLKLRAASPADRPAALAAEPARQLFEAAREGRQAKILKSLRLTAHPGQRVHLQEVRQHSYVADHDVQIATAAGSLDPIVDVLNVGAGVDLTAFLEPFGNAVTLEVRADLADLESIEEKKIQLSKEILPVAAEGKHAGPRLDVPWEGTLHLPRGTHDALRTMVTIREKETMLAGSVLRGGRTIAFLLTPSVVRLDEKPAPAPVLEEQRLLRLFDVSPLTRKIQDYAGPRTELVSPSAGGGGALSGATFTLDEPFQRMTPDRLSEMIRTQIAPETWGNKRNSIKSTGEGTLVVRQKPEVLAELEKFLGSMIAARSQMITTEAFVIGFKKGARAAWEKDVPALAPGGVFADSAAFDRLLEAACGGGDLRLLDAAEITGFPDQRVHAFRFHEEAYVQDYEPQVSTSLAIMDPIVGTLLTGFLLDVRPRFTSGTEQISLDLRASSTTAELKTLPQLSTGVSPLHLATAAGPRWNSQAAALQGKVTLVSIQSRGDEGGEVALFVRARANLLR